MTTFFVVVGVILPIHTVTHLGAVLKNIYGKFSYSLKIMAINYFSQPQPDSAMYCAAGRVQTADLRILHHGSTFNSTYKQYWP